MKTLLWWALGLAAAFFLYKVIERLRLSRAKNPSLEGHPRWSRRLARLVPQYELTADAFYMADGACPELAARRRAGFERLADLYATRFARSAALSREAAGTLSDLQFTARYRVPFPFSRQVRERLSAGSFVQASDGVMLTDVDGNRLWDLTGSYGVNVFGNDFYKPLIEGAVSDTSALGPVLGNLMPVTVDNAHRLAKISGLDEVSFHMSGTEAVMQAVRLARYHTGRRRLVRFSGAYHGWWGDVQPGVGNPVTERDTFTLRDMSARALGVLRSRRDIACVLVNPLQALHPNRAAPGDSALLMGRRAVALDREAYASWLRELRAVCTERGIALIFDEVFVGFRIAPGGAQEYFGVHADLVTYGKSVAGGLPIGVLCGRADWMRRYRPDRPADICFARGTFNSHPYVMAAMNRFLRALEEPAARALYQDLDATWQRRERDFSARLQAAGVPVRVAAFTTIWTVWFTTPSRYHWMLTFYLRAQGLALSWVGSGRLIFTLAHTDEDVEAIAGRFMSAALEMQADGWWELPAGADERTLKRGLVRELVAARFRPAAHATSDR